MKDALNWKLEGRKRPLGRSKKRWIDEPNQNFRILGVDNLEELANDTKEWRKLRGAMIALKGLEEPKKKIVFRRLRDIFFTFDFAGNNQFCLLFNICQK